MWVGMALFALGMGWLAAYVVRLGGAHYAGYEERYLAAAEEQLNALFVFTTPERLLSYSIAGGCSGVLIGALLGLALGGVAPVVLAVLFGLTGFFIPRMVVTVMVYLRRNKFLIQLPDALDVLCKGLKAGLSITQGLQLVATEMPRPVSQEFGLLVKDMQLGRSIPDSLKLLYRRMPLPEVRLVVLAVSLSRRLGGDLTEALNAVAQTVRNRFNVEKKVKTLTAEARMQAIVVCLLPFFLFFVFLYINPEMMTPLVNSAAGAVVLGVVLLLEILGGTMMWRMSKVKY